MSDNTTLVDRLRARTQLHYSGRPEIGYDHVIHDPLCVEAAARIAELEAEVVRLTAALATMEEAALRNGVALQAEAREHAAVRIAELEAWNLAHVGRIAKLEAELIRYEHLITEIEAERDRLKEVLAWYADTTDYDLSVDAGERARAALQARPAP